MIKTKSHLFCDGYYCTEVVTKTIKVGNKKLTIQHEFNQTLDDWDNYNHTYYCANGKRHRIKKYVPRTKLLKHLH